MKRTYRNKGYALLLVLVFMSLFSILITGLLQKFDQDIMLAVRNAETTAVFYYQEGRLRLVRYLYTQELLEKGKLTEARKQEIYNLVFNETYNWRERIANEIKSNVTLQQLQENSR
jgi:type II secretory pathway component PulJ